MASDAEQSQTLLTLNCDPETAKREADELSSEEQQQQQRRRLSRATDEKVKATKVDSVQSTADQNSQWNSIVLSRASVPAKRSAWRSPARSVLGSLVGGILAPLAHPFSSSLLLEVNSTPLGPHPPPPASIP